MPLSDPRDFHVPQSSYTKEDLLKSSEGGYFGPGNAQLPAPPMLMMDRIIEISVDGGEFGKGHVIAELDITPDLWFRGDIKPDIKRVRYEVSMRQVRRGKLALGIADGSVFADDICVYVAKNMRVGLIAS